jgi:hypothetical protein
VNLRKNKFKIAKLKTLKHYAKILGYLNASLNLMTTMEEISEEPTFTQEEIEAELKKMEGEKKKRK